MKLFFESLSTCFSLHVCFLQGLNCFLALRFRGGNAYFQLLLILSMLTGYYFRVIIIIIINKIYRNYSGVIGDESDKWMNDKYSNYRSEGTPITCIDTLILFTMID